MNVGYAPFSVDLNPSILLVLPMLVNPISTLRQLKGAPLSVLIALTIVQPRHVSSSWLSGVTGYAIDSITSATWYLKEFGFVDCDSHRTNWRLTEEGVQQLPLPVSMIEPEPKNPDPEKPDPELLTYLKLYLNGKENFIEVSKQSFNDPDPEKPDPSNSIETCRNLLFDAGIHDPTATELCGLDYATYDYLDAHIEKARRDNIPIRLLIHRIREKDDKPNVQSSAFLQSDEYRQMKYGNPYNYEEE